MSGLVGTLLSVLLTVLLGSYVAHVWQMRSSKESRFFEGTKFSLDSMVRAYSDIADGIGRRIYTAQRLARLSPADDQFCTAKEEFRESILDWNKRLLSLEVQVKTLFKDSYVSDFERLQQELARISGLVSARLKTIDNRTPPAYGIVRSLETLRHDYFEFIRQMVVETNNLYRQMHFGVLVGYNADSIKYYSTPGLIKSLFTGPRDDSAIVRSPTNFGRPVSTWEARLGVYEH